VTTPGGKLDAAQLANQVPGASLGNAVLKTGDTMTGRLYVSSANVATDYGVAATTLAFTSLSPTRRARPAC